MATIISKANYLKIADNYADLRTILSSAAPYLYEAANTVVTLNDFEPTKDLMDPIYDTYVQQTPAIASNAPYLSAVRALNNHVLRRGNYASLDAYFDANDIAIDPVWRDLCESAGFTVNDAYVI